MWSWEIGSNRTLIKEKLHGQREGAVGCIGEWNFMHHSVLNLGTVSFDARLILLQHVRC